MSADTLERPEVEVADPTLQPSRASELLFSREEIRQFDLDDVEAGRRIGKILTTLFVYTLVAMSIVIWWSLSVIN
jgi:hypothetical protein